MTVSLMNFFFLTASPYLLVEFEAAEGHSLFTEGSMIPKEMCTWECTWESRKQSLDVLKSFLTGGFVESIFSKSIFFVKFAHSWHSEAARSSFMFVSDPASLSKTLSL